jgi:hypothetical protein
MDPAYANFRAGIQARYGGELRLWPIGGAE